MSKLSINLLTHVFELIRFNCVQMDEKIFELSLKIHGVGRKNYDDSSESGNSSFDERYYSIKPPPFTYEFLKDRIVKLDNENSSERTKGNEQFLSVDKNMLCAPTNILDSSIIFNDSYPSQTHVAYKEKQAKLYNSTNRSATPPVTNNNSSIIDECILCCTIL